MLSRLVIIIIGTWDFAAGASETIVCFQGFMYLELRCH